MSKNKLSIFSAVLINMNIMIGAAIFIGPSMMALSSKNLGFLSWVIIALIFSPVVWSVIQISKFHPECKSFYDYSQNLGRTAMFISGWTYFLGYLCVVAIHCVGFTDILYRQLQINFIKTNPLIFFGLLIGAISYLNLFNLKIVSKINSALTLFKLIPIIGIILITPFYLNPNFHIDWSHISSLKYGLPIALFGYWGFESCTNLSHFIKGGRKGAILAIFISFLGTAFIYTAFHFGLLNIMNYEKLANDGFVASIYCLNIQSPIVLMFLNYFIATVIASVHISTAYGSFIAGSSILYNLASEKFFLFSSKVSNLNINERPKNAILIKGIITFLFLVLINDKTIIASITNAGFIVSLALTFISLFLIQIKKKESYQIIITILSFIALTILIAYSWLTLGMDNTERFKNILPLLILIIIGLVLFKLENKRKQKSNT